MYLKIALHLVLLGAPFMLLFQGANRSIAANWTTTEGSYGPLILAVSVYLVWINRKKIAGTSPAPSPVIGGMMVAAGCFALFAGKISSTIMVQQLAIVPVLLGIALLYGGFPLLKLLFLPISYLIFLTGFIEQLLGAIAIELQLITAWIATRMLALTGMPVFLTDTMIQLPHISLEVVRSCSGINHIVALMALAVPMAYLTQNRLSKKLLVIAAALGIGLLANGLRVALIGIYALWNAGADLHGPSETLYVSFIFFFGMIVLFIFNQLVRRGRKADAAKAPPAPRADDMESAGSHRTAGAVAAGLFGLTLLALQLHTHQHVPLHYPLTQLPGEINGFIAVDGERPTYERIRSVPADEELARIYRHPDGAFIELYVGYYALQDKNRRIIDYRRDWMHENVRQLNLRTAGNASFTVNKSHIRGHVPATDIYFWYQMNDRIITDRFAGKFITFWNSLVRRRNQGAVVIFQSQLSEKDSIGLIGALAPAITRHLSTAGQTDPS